MPYSSKLTDQLFKLNNSKGFNDLALEIFQLQYENNLVYKAFVDKLTIDPSGIKHFAQIPFLPIEFFKTRQIVTGRFKPDLIFTSSGTTALEASKHYVREAALYEQSFKKAFKLFFGHPEEFVILALLPSYLERDGSSLVYMVDKLIKAGGHRRSGFYLYEYKKLSDVLFNLRKQKRKVILIGVSYALLDLAEQYPLDYPELIVMETGGMKGRRKEMVRDELHEILKLAFNTKKIYSEYGMTELLSQAYSKGDGKFHCPPWMKVLIRDTEDPLSLVSDGITGGITIIDLANIHSCSFVATQDLGKKHTDGSFEVLGRFDSSDARGCNLMVY